MGRKVGYIARWTGFVGVAKLFYLFVMAAGWPDSRWAAGDKAFLFLVLAGAS
jgi:hypothetical protein